MINIKDNGPVQTDAASHRKHAVLWGQSTLEDLCDITHLGQTAAIPKTPINYGAYIIELTPRTAIQNRKVYGYVTQIPGSGKR